MAYYLTQNEHKVVWIYFEPPENENYIEVEELPAGEGPIVIREDGTLGRKDFKEVIGSTSNIESMIVTALLD